VLSLAAHTAQNRIGRSSDFRAARRQSLLAAASRIRKSRTAPAMANKIATYVTARLQRRGRPGFAPEFPVCRPKTNTSGRPPTHSPHFIGGGMRCQWFEIVWSQVGASVTNRRVQSSALVRAKWCGLVGKTGFFACAIAESAKRVKWIGNLARKTRMTGCIFVPFNFSTLSPWRLG
jgi:hypothetical protein